MLIIPATVITFVLPRDPSTIYKYTEDQITELFSTKEDVITKDSTYLGTNSRMIFYEGVKSNDFDFCTFHLYKNNEEAESAKQYLINNYSITENDDNTIYVNMPTFEGIEKGVFIFKGNMILYTYQSTLDFISKEEFEKRLKEGKFVEHTLYNNNYYGCGIDQVEDNKVIVLDPNGFLSSDGLMMQICEEKYDVQKLCSITKVNYSYVTEAVLLFDKDVFSYDESGIKSYDLYSYNPQIPYVNHVQFIFDHDSDGYLSEYFVIDHNSLTKKRSQSKTYPIEMKQKIKI